MVTNPLATEAQRRIEDRAMALLARSDLQRVRGVVTMLWKNVAGWPARDQADRFDNMIDEYMFHHAFRAANGDPNNPEVARFMAPAHRWFGRDVPGSRWAGDSPDFIYRTIPIAHGGRYEIRGRPTCAEPPTVNYSLMADNTASPVTQALLDSLDMEFDHDGSFVITVDDTPAAGRPNHIQTKPGADFIMVRDALGDWNTQSANALTVTRLDPGHGAKSEDAMAQHCARIALDNVYYSYYCTQSGAGQPPNDIRPPMSSAAFGGMATQAGTKGNLQLGDGDALIVRSNAAGAQFRNLMLTDAFHMSIDYWNRTSSFNMRQMAADEDGDFTFVIAHRDPGVHNWIDTGGLERVIFGQRWQAFRRDTDNPDPWMNVRQVRFDEIERELPDGVVRIDTASRAEQIALRRTGFVRRFAED
ncbi:hypothetical protein [Novosphingobium sp. JCM 18896]|uniref:hypothetical protein n=1 Tax=Novosphingobium sp. JCM 18896 TaxID=2989731 RepID=UPI002222780E|nr:hypothetical protein [Novosphingobium sp. JCM 18896]MCW1430133.1 hypothetical protein [Novosphingobium sp. JCM 18896]